MPLLLLTLTDLAQIILDKCIVVNEEETSSGVTHITYNYEFIDDFNDTELGVVEKFLLNKALVFQSERPEDDILLTAMQSDGSTIEQPTTLLVHSGWGPKVYNKDNHTMALMVINLFRYSIKTDYSIGKF